MALNRTVAVRPASNTASAATVGEADATLVMAARGNEGVTALEISTGWFLPNALVNVEELDATDFPEAVVGFHSPTAIVDDSIRKTSSCLLLNAGNCWGYASSIAGRHVLRVLLLEGDSAVWRELEELYSAAFERRVGVAYMESLEAKGRAVRY